MPKCWTGSRGGSIRERHCSHPHNREAEHQSRSCCHYSPCWSLRMWGIQGLDLGRTRCSGFGRRGGGRHLACFWGEYLRDRWKAKPGGKSSASELPSKDDCRQEWEWAYEVDGGGESNVGKQVQWLQLRLPKISREVPVIDLGFKTTIAFAGQDYNRLCRKRGTCCCSRSSPLFEQSQTC